MIYSIGISIAFLLSLLLLSKKGKSKADIFLAIWILLIGVHLLLYYLHISNLIFQTPYLLGIQIPFPLLHGPFLFIYTSLVTNQLHQNKWYILLHFSPPVVAYVCLIQFYTLPTSEKIQIYNQEGGQFKPFMFVLLISILFSGILYVIWSIILLKNHKRTITDQFSSTEKITLQWLNYLIYGISLIWILILISDELVFYGVILFILFIGYFGIKQVGIFTQQTLTIHESKEEVQIAEYEELVAPKKKYAKSGLSADQVTLLHQQLLHLIKETRPYLESELTLVELAKRLGIHSNYLSQVINEKEGVNFYDYINRLRIDAFTKLVKNPENKKYTMIALAYDCGFNSKSSFNKNFKKVIGKSPSAYME